jgi:ferritin-like metal-binding protein YciE
MGLFTSTEFNSLSDLLNEQIEDLYDAEHRLVEAIPKMAEAATSASLKTAFLEHLEQTKNHVLRLEAIFSDLGLEPKRQTCQAMKGIVAEGAEVIGASGSKAVKDAALIAAAQRVEHYEMAGYGSARAFAEQLGLARVAAALLVTLEEEKQTDEKLTRLALEKVNVEALAAVSARA